MKEADWASSTDPTAMLAFLGTAGGASTRKLDLFSVACCRRVLSLLNRDYVTWCPRAREVHERYADSLAGEEELQAIKARADADWYDAAGAVAHPGEVDYYAVAYAAAAAKATDPVAIARDAARAIAYDAVARSNDFTVAAINASWERADYQKRAQWDTDEKTVATLPAFQAAYAAESARQASLLRCIFGNPFRPCRLVSPSLLSTAGHLLRILAHAAYDDRKLPEGMLAPAALTVLADVLAESGYDEPLLIGHLLSPVAHVRGCFALDHFLSRGGPP